MAEAPQAIFRHIMVPTDGSKPSVAAGRLAVRLAAVHRARITFVYVVDDTVVEELAGESGRMAKQIQHELEVTGQRYLNYLSRLATNANLTSNQVIRYGLPYGDVCSVAPGERRHRRPTAPLRGRVVAGQGLSHRLVVAPRVFRGAEAH